MIEFPQKLNAGDSLVIEIDPQIIGDQTYKSDSYALTINLRGLGTPVDITAAVSGNGWKATLTPAMSAKLLPGAVKWAAVATSSTERVTLGHGLLTIDDNVSALNSYDPRTVAQKALTDAENALATFSSSGGKIKKYTIGSRQMEFATTQEIMVAISYWRIRVANEAGFTRDIKVRFNYGL